MASAYTDLKMGVTHTLEKIPGVGKGMVDTLRRTKSSIKQFVIPGMFFENMGLTYLGPVDGHDTRKLIRVFKRQNVLKGLLWYMCLPKRAGDMSLPCGIPPGFTELLRLR